jgi:hypothetical protein
MELNQEILYEYLLDIMANFAYHDTSIPIIISVEVKEALPEMYSKLINIEYNVRKESYKMHGQQRQLVSHMEKDHYNSTDAIYSGVLKYSKYQQLLRDSKLKELLQ